MSEQDKTKHAERIGQKETKLAKKVKLAKTYNHEDAIKNPHKYHEKSLFNCGNPKCVMCMNPRKSFNEKTMQERRFEQSADLMSDKGYEIGSLEDAEEFARKQIGRAHV